PYKYGTKELDRMHGLDLYDSQARWYDSLLGRTSTIDPKAEKYYSVSPYLWCAGNLVRNIDENGQEYGDVFYTRDDAAIDFSNCYNGISIFENVEYVTNIYVLILSDGSVAFSYTKPQKGTEDEVANPLLPENNETIVARAHTHAAYSIFYKNNYFSKDDIATYREKQVDGYVATPCGLLKEYDYKQDQVNIVSYKIPSDIMDIRRVNSVSAFVSIINKILKN
ncbi:MAG: DUF4329 domain-containing protein, partial [Muribaculaceae bacterium]